MLPAILILIAFRYIPAFSAVYHSFTDWTGTNNAAFVGLAQYQALVADPVFWTSLRNVMLYTFGRTVLATLMAFIAAELVYNLRNRQSQWLWRVAFTLPMVIPSTVILLIWRQIYAARLGLLNEFLRAVGLDQWAQPWLGQPNTALLAIMVIGFPLVSGFAFLVISSALMELSTEINEASLLDGCSPLRRVFAIDIPSIIGPTVLVIILSINAGLQEFAPMLIITSGGPVNATPDARALPLPDCLYLWQIRLRHCHRHCADAHHAGLQLFHPTCSLPGGYRCRSPIAYLLARRLPHAAPPARLAPRLAA